MVLTLTTAKVVEYGLRTAAADFADSDVHESLSQMLKHNPLKPHEAPEPVKLQAALYAGVR